MFRPEPISGYGIRSRTYAVLDLVLYEVEMHVVVQPTAVQRRNICKVNKLKVGPTILISKARRQNMYSCI